MSVAVSSLCLFLSLGVVNSQTFPYVSFMGQILANHSYVDLSRVGSDRSGIDSLQCHTDLDTCCSSSEETDWYFPDGTKLPFSGNIYQGRLSRRVDLRHTSSGSLSYGIYHCAIPTNSVHGDLRDSVFVGLYSGHTGIFNLTIAWTN